LSRNSDPRERLAIYGMIQDAGAVIVDAEGRVTDPADDSGMGEMDFYLRSFFASQERKHILRKTQDGKARCASEGKWTGQGLAYALRWDDDKEKFAVDAEQALIVRRIYGEASLGKPVRKIAAGLNADGVPSLSAAWQKRPDRYSNRLPPKGEWGGAGILRVLHQEAYLTGRLYTTVNGQRITHDHAFKPIIAQELWDRVQHSLRARQCRPGVRWTTKPALLRFLARCGRCSKTMHVHSDGRGHNKGRRYYACGAGHKPWHRLEPTDEQAWSMLVEAFSDPSQLLKATGLAAAPIGAFNGKSQVASCKAKLKALLAHEIETVGLRRRGKLSAAAYEVELRNIKTDRATLEGSLKVAESAITQAAIATSAIDSILNLMREERDRVLALIEKANAQEAVGMRRALFQTYTFEQQRRLVEMLVPRGVDDCGFFLHDHGVEIKGVAELSDACANMIRGDPGPARQCRAAK
jgi:hypothetical protein